ncbi:MAG: OmpH family outer membrane protein [Bacteroidota bacterium]
MKRFTAILLLTFCLAGFTKAQKLGYVDSQFILEQMEEYQSAQEEIDALSKKWQKELEAMHANIQQMYKDYQAEEVLLTEDVKKQRQEDIFEAERNAKDYKKQKFGYDGELYKVQDEKIKPIQDKVFEAIEAVAKERRLDIILDKAGNSGILYTNAAFDRTDDVMVKLGLSRR